MRNKEKISITLDGDIINFLTLAQKSTNKNRSKLINDILRIHFMYVLLGEVPQKGSAK